MRLAQRLIFSFLLFLFGAEAKAQVFKEAQTRHRFAQLNFGLDTRVWDSYIQPTDIQSELRLLIGGTHFWGHADFFIGIPLARLWTMDFNRA